MLSLRIAISLETGCLKFSLVWPLGLNHNPAKAKSLIDTRHWGRQMNFSGLKFNGTDLLISDSVRNLKPIFLPRVSLVLASVLSHTDLVFMSWVQCSEPGIAHLTEIYIHISWDVHLITWFLLGCFIYPTRIWDRSFFLSSKDG